MYASVTFCVNQYTIFSGGGGDIGVKQDEPLSPFCFYFPAGTWCSNNVEI